MRPDSPEAIARIKYQLRRGMLELDSMLRLFFDDRYTQLDQDDQQLFVQMLQASDPQLYRWLIGAEDPQEAALLTIVKQVRQYFAGSKS